jgi:hypothetical protein
VCSQIHTKHINTLCGQNVDLLDVKLVVHIVTIRFQGDKNFSFLSFRRECEAGCSGNAPDVYSN